MKVLVVHPGTQYAHHLVKELQRLGILYKFYTGFAIAEDNPPFFFNLLPKKALELIKNRIISNVPSNKIKSFYFFEIISLLFQKLGVNSELVFYYRNKFFQQCINIRILKNADVIIGFDTSSWLLAKKAREIGIPFILDVSIGHPNEKNLIYKSLSGLYVGWDTQLKQKSKNLVELENKEVLLSNKIVVPSSFVKSTYIKNGITDEKILVNPFGTDFVGSVINRDITKREKIRFLFFGGLSARKGLPFLLEAWRRIDLTKAELTICGYGKIPSAISVPKGVKNLGPIEKSQRLDLYSSHDVFLFPSNFEGFAQVQIEAAACGLPVVGTYSAGTTELIQSGISGFIIEENNVKSLVNAINYFLDNKEKVLEMGEASREASKAFTWAAYGSRWIQILKSIERSK